MVLFQFNEILSAVLRRQIALYQETYLSFRIEIPMISYILRFCSNLSFENAYFYEVNLKLQI